MVLPSNLGSCQLQLGDFRVNPRQGHPAAAEGPETDCPQRDRQDHKYHQGKTGSAGAIPKPPAAEKIVPLPAAARNIGVH